MKKSIWIFLAVLVLSPGFTVPQQRTITGNVTSGDDGNAIPGVHVALKGSANAAVTNDQGNYRIIVQAQGGTLVFSCIGYQTQEIKTGARTTINVVLVLNQTSPNKVVTADDGSLRPYKKDRMGSPAESKAMYETAYARPQDYSPPQWNTEEYDAVNENIFHEVSKNPLSTFSIDVDAASYSNMRRFINNGQRPPKDAVRIEEMINYFDYDYEQPGSNDPFAVITEISTAPWNSKHKLVHIGLQGRRIPTEKLPPSNLVFLLDVSGSMNQPNKLPLLKTSFKMLVEQLRPQDHVAIVVYAGAAGLVLEPTPGSEKKKIIEALDRLAAGGSTAGGAGINLAYAVAKENFKREGNNRIILATDGDFNIGESSNASMERLIEEKRKDGIFLTVLGFGMGNYKDSKMEILADKGNGNYAYIDNISESRKVLVNEFGGTLFTIAKDVKLQIEFNPAKVNAYRLIGYENRMLKSEDFNDDKKDAGELGSGHTVTALYEIIPAGVESEFIKIDELKYQTMKIDPKAGQSKEIMTIKLRYKKPNEDISKLIVHPLIDSNTPLAKTSDNFRWSASVAAFGMLLRESDFIKEFTYDQVVQMAQQSKGVDREGYRIEFINMVKSFGLVASR
ncbi:MAG: von Willebrand factor type A domain-containing protein [Cyclobacteriaceae bacterium]|nr:von Willebrand factor type A domain-containing protein [Cyclobacteriaceae bacterium]MDH4296841.1 von Willebrand factor type A domain-containing protein [Cyclobacteriaceae bacterium]MDH5247579.1 von Willebrand factor type A domain-containing protein [Cyclobacteriaceae bacterium]